MATNPYLARAQALQDQRWGDQTKFKLAPLSQALTADQTRLALYADPNDPSKAVAGKEKEYQQTLDNMTATIGQMRGILGEKQPGANPLEAAAGDVLSKLHITNHLKNHVAQVRQQNAAKYQGENQARAGEYAQGALPYADTPEGQAESKKTEDAIKEIEARGRINVDAQKRADYADYKQKHPEYQGSFEEWTAQQSAQGKSSAPETDYQKAQLDYKEKALALAEAKQKAASDPNNPAAKAALLRAQGEAEKSHAYMIRALAGASGTDLSGKPLPGALETPEGTPVGSMFASNFYKSAQGMAQLNDAQGAINSVGKSVKALFDSGGTLTDPKVATALANPQWTAAKLAQGIVGDSLSPEEREAVIAIRSAQENIQGMRKAAGGGLSNEQVNRLEAQLPGPNTPNAEYAQQQLQYLNQTLSRLSQGVPAAEGGATFQGPEGPKTKALRAKASGAWHVPTDAPHAPKEDGKFLKADGKVIAVSKGGEWVQPPDAH